MVVAPPKTDRKTRAATGNSKPRVFDTPEAPTKPTVKKAKAKKPTAAKKTPGAGRGRPAGSTNKKTTAAAKPKATKVAKKKAAPKAPKAAGAAKGRGRPKKVNGAVKK